MFEYKKPEVEIIEFDTDIVVVVVSRDENELPTEY